MEESGKPTEHKAHSLLFLLLYQVLFFSGKLIDSLAVKVEADICRRVFSTWAWCYSSVCKYSDWPKYHCYGMLWHSTCLIINSHTPCGSEKHGAIRNLVRLYFLSVSCFGNCFAMRNFIWQLNRAMGRPQERHRNFFSKKEWVSSATNWETEKVYAFQIRATPIILGMNSLVAAFLTQHCNAIKYFPLATVLCWLSEALKQIYFLILSSQTTILTAL